MLKALGVLSLVLALCVQVQAQATPLKKFSQLAPSTFAAASNQPRNLQTAGADTGVPGIVEPAKYHWRGSVYCLILSLLLFATGIIFIFYQIKLLRLWLGFISIMFAYMLVNILSSLLEVKYPTDTSLEWFIVLGFLGFVLAFSASFAPMVGFVFGGFIFPVGFVFWIGHISACFDGFRNQGLYGSQSPYLLMSALTAGSLGAWYGVETYSLFQKRKYFGNIFGSKKFSQGNLAERYSFQCLCRVYRC
jgi:hypothetical protein